MSTLKDQVVHLLLERAYVRRAEPFKLSAGGWSHDYVDCRRALANGDALQLVGEAVAAAARDAGVEYEAVGGMTMGADPIAHAVALVAGTRWFSVRKEAKGHGREKLIEGADVGSGTRVLVVDDVVSTGRSLLLALDAIDAVGARPVLAVTLLDRGESTAKALADRGVAYAPLTTYRDLGIEPI